MKMCVCVVCKHGGHCNVPKEKVFRNGEAGKGSGLSQVLLNAHNAWHRVTGSPGVSLLSVSDCISRFPLWQMLVPAYVDKTSLSKYFPSKVCVVEIQVRLSSRTQGKTSCV